MDTVREKWDIWYRPLYTKIIVAAVVFCGIWGLAAPGPLNGTMALIAAGVSAFLCFWNPGVVTWIYVAVFFTSFMHINSTMVAFICMLVLIYCVSGYASIAVMAATPMLFISASIPEGMYWGMLTLAMYFAYRSREHWISFIYPSYFALLLVFFGKAGTEVLLFNGDFILTKSRADSIETFLRGIEFNTDTNKIIAIMPELVTIMAIVIAAGVIIWLVFRNGWLRTKSKNVDIVEALMFLSAALVLVFLALAVKYGLGYETDIPYVSIVVSVALGYVVTRPFASDRVAETFVTKKTLRHRKAAAIDFLAVKPKDASDADDLTDGIRGEIDAMDGARRENVLIQRDESEAADIITEMIAKKYGCKIIKIEHHVFETLYGNDKEKYFDKIFLDAEAQAPVVICFKDVDKFFFGIDEFAGEYVKRERRAYMNVADKLSSEAGVSVVCITDDMTKLDNEILKKWDMGKRIVL